MVTETPDSGQSGVPTYKIDVNGLTAQPSKYTTDNGDVTINNGDTLTIKGGATDLTDNNIGVVADGSDTLKVKLAKDVKGLNSVETKEIKANVGTIQTLVVNEATVKNIKAETMKVGDKVSISNNGIDMGNTVISNVAAGVNAGDAANVGQLRSVERKLGEVSQDSQKGDAMSAALAALHTMQYDPYEKTQFMAGLGFYRGEQAVALGFAHYPKEDFMFHGGVAYAGSNHLMANVGMTFKFGDHDDRESNMPEAYKNGPISSIYVLQDEVTELKARNAQLEGELDTIKKQLSALLDNKNGN